MAMGGNRMCVSVGALRIKPYEHEDESNKKVLKLKTKLCPYNS